MINNSSSYFEFYSKEEAIRSALLLSNRLGYDTKVYELDFGIWFCQYKDRVKTGDEVASKQRITRADIEKHIVRGILVYYPDIPYQTEECKSKELHMTEGFISEDKAIEHIKTTVRVKKILADHKKIDVKEKICVFKFDDGLWIVSQVIDGSERTDGKSKNNREKDTTTKMPDLEKGVAIRAFSFGHYGAILYECCPMKQDRIPFFLRILVVKYRYVLCVFGAALMENELIITHERITLGGSCLCSLEYDNVRKNYGVIDNNIGENGFLDSAFHIVKSKYEKEAKVIREVAIDFWN